MARSSMIRLSPLWSSGAVLQHGQRQSLCGTATPQQLLRVTLQQPHILHQFEAHTDAHGIFSVDIPPQPPSGPWTCTISQADVVLISLHDLWFGQLLLFAGQSNVGWPLRHYPGQLADLQEKLQAQPGIAAVRAYLTNVYQPVAPDEQPSHFRRAGHWQQLTPTLLADWPALLCHFSQHYQAADGATAMMLGLVDISWPGSAIDAWTQQAEGTNATQAWQAGALFASRLKPWLQQPFSALVWYQGEQDAMGKNAAHYGVKLQHWLHSCRQVAGWEFPLLLVQIAGFGHSGLPQLQHGFVLVRQAQQHIAATARQVMLVSAADLGAEDDIHPPFKAELARRLALQLPQLLAAGLRSSISQLTAHLLERITTTAQLRLPQDCSWQHSGPLDGFFTHSPAVGWQSAPAFLHAAHHQVHITVPADADTLCYGMSARPHLTLYTAEGLPLWPGIWTLPV
ncbi:MAG: sialate O-acetylesterase [Rheinheimera sp.]|nr:sialate O-acetylesterase [Rheinheimera sp.]